MERTVESLHLQGLQSTAKSQFRWVPSFLAFNALKANVRSRLAKQF